MALNPAQKRDIDTVAAIARQWCVDNGDKTLELDSEGYANADEWGMHTLCAGIVRLYYLYNSEAIVQPSFEMQRWFGITAGVSAQWMKNHRNLRDLAHEEKEVYTLVMVFLRLYKEVVDRGIIVPPTHQNSTTTIQ